jgi:hypothetical protein
MAAIAAVSILDPSMRAAIERFPWPNDSSPANGDGGALACRHTPPRRHRNAEGGAIFPGYASKARMGCVGELVDEHPI